MAEIVGTPNDDIITPLFVSDGVTGGIPTDEPDIISGEDDNDFIDGGGGDDSLSGNAGDDTLSGGLGSDDFDGGDGNDTVDYGYSTTHRWRIDLAEGLAWSLPDNSRPPALDNRAGTTETLVSIENVIGGSGRNHILGDANDNILDGGPHRDDIDGREGNDILIGGLGSDTVRGGAGDDYFISGEGNDYIIDGGDGDDTLDYSRSTNRNNVFILDRDLIVDGRWRVNSAQRDYLEVTGIENIIGGDNPPLPEGATGRDDMVGTDANEKFWGMGGNDQIHGKGGDDEIYGGEGSDRLIGGLGRDLLDGNRGQDTADYFYAGSGRLIDLGRDRADSPGFSRSNNGTPEGADDGDTDTLLSIERVRGSNFDDVIKGGLVSSIRNNVLHGAEGNDEIWGRGGDNELYGDGGNDTFKVDRVTNRTWGENRIKDWGLGQDLIDLSEWRTGPDARSIEISYGSENTTITISGVQGLSIVVENAKSQHFDLSALDAGIIRAQGMNVEVLSNPVPSYEWYYGCGPTSMASMIAYWDLNGYSSLYTAEGWEQVSVMQNIKDEVMSPDHIAKYAYYSIIDNPDAPDFAPNSIATFARSGFGDERHHTTTSTGGARDGLQDYAAWRGYDFTISRVGMEGADQDAIWARLVDEIEAGRPAMAYLATALDPNHYVPIFGVAELPDGNRWYNHYNHSSTVSTVEGEAETPIWHEFRENVRWTQESPEAPVTPVPVPWGIHTMYFFKPRDVTLTGDDGGNDTLVAGGGDDRVYGYDGNDALDGGIGHDRLYGGGDNDTLTGGIGNDYLSASSGDDELYGGPGNDTLYGSRGNDSVDGGTGNDVVSGGSGTDILTGGSEDDTFVFSQGYGADIITDFGDGADRIDARGIGFDTFARFGALAASAGNPNLVDTGDFDISILVSTIGADLTLDFGNGDALIVLNNAALDVNDFVLV